MKVNQYLYDDRAGLMGFTAYPPVSAQAKIHAKKPKQVYEVFLSDSDWGTILLAYPIWFFIYVLVNINDYFVIVDFGLSDGPYLNSLIFSTLFVLLQFFIFSLIIFFSCDQRRITFTSSGIEIKSRKYGVRHYRFDEFMLRILRVGRESYCSYYTLELCINDLTLPDYLREMIIDAAIEPDALDAQARGYLHFFETGEVQSSFPHCNHFFTKNRGKDLFAKWLDFQCMLNLYLYVKIYHKLMIGIVHKSREILF